MSTIDNIILSTTNEAIFMAGEVTEAVVKHDTAMLAAAQAKAGLKGIEQLVIEREIWETTVYRTSNDMLYGLLQKCYALYKGMEGTSANAVVLRDGLTNYLNLNGINCNKSSHTIVKIVKCVFGDDRRRASAYGIVLRSALAEKVAVEDIPSYIRNKGGIEEIRLAKSPNAMTATQKANAAEVAVQADNMGVFVSRALETKLDAGNIGKPVVLIGTWQADGSVVIRSDVQNEGAVKAALASYYSANKEAVHKQAAEKQAAIDEQIKQQAVRQLARQQVQKQKRLLY